MESVYHCLKDLSEMRETHTPVYCFKTHARKPNEKKLIEPKRFVILEGILAFYDEVDANSFRKSDLYSTSRSSSTVMLISP